MSVTVNMLWKTSGTGRDQTAITGGLACSVGGAVTDGVTEALNHFCSRLAQGVETLLTYYGRH